MLFVILEVEALLPTGKPHLKKISIGKGKELKKGTKIAVLSTGPFGNNIIEMTTNLTHPELLGHYNLPFIKPLDEALLKTVFNSYQHIITLEDGCKIGGFGSAILEFANNHSFTNSISIFGVKDHFITHGSTEELQQITNLDNLSISTYINQLTKTI